MRCALIILTVLIGGSAPAVAGTFTPPAGCTAFLTVQSSDCSVDQHYVCDADPAGESWRASFAQDGVMTFVGKIDSETQWLESRFLLDGRQERLMTPAPDPASLTELLATGLDSYDFSLNTTAGPRRVVGFDRIVERDLSIDGEPLHRTEYNIRITNDAGVTTYAAMGSEYVSAKHRRFFSGYGEVTSSEAPYRYNGSPIEFIYPGEEGFLETTPKYGCDVLSAGFSLNGKGLLP